MTTFASVASSLEAKAPDATKHVNYSLGMVLGVDDFNQEFAYLAGRDRWLARDAIGYGTLCGLRIQTEVVASKGPRLTVTTGSALTPRGQLVCVKPAQCAYLNDWLAANQSQVAPLLGSPLSGTIDLYLTLCYRDCPVDLVPIPGAPCRAEDELMAPSRLVDDFSLDLRTSPPDQSEEDVLRQFATWLRTLNFGEGGPITSPEDFEAMLRDSIQVVGGPLTSPLTSPVSSPLDGGAALVFGSPLISVNLNPGLAQEYYRAAFRVWIEDLRPKVHAVCACSGGCCGGSSHDMPKADECLLLARVSVPVIRTSGNWVVDDLGTIEIDESRRPMLLHLRMLQELLGGTGGASLGGGPTVVAAGNVGVTGAQLPVFNSLAATKIDNSRLRLTFGGYVRPAASPLAGSHQYIVKVLPHLSALVNPMVVLESFDATGIVLRVTRAGAVLLVNQLEALSFSVEVTRIG
ncbi:MAG TPA: hypothetical protein VEK57_28870 [Thermoanaerobaculia bacterium]|nr:hypothetical protein [Thermoanaerobaculia bacterium]